MFRRTIEALLLAAGMCSAAGQVRVIGPVSQADLIGEWYKSKMSNTEFVDPSTGARSSPSGDRLNVRFEADGTFKLGELIQSSLYRCTTSVFGYRVGVYRVVNSTIDVQISSNTLTSKDNCHAQWNYKKQLPSGRTVYRAQLGRDAHGLVLILTGRDGEQTTYARETGKPLLGN